MNRTSPLVSVVIPVFNYDRFVGDAVRSALEQTYKPVEVIVVDDGSTDDSGKVVQGFGSSVSYLKQSNQGLSAARNVGIRRACGEMIQLLDADDELAPDQLEVFMAASAASPEASILLGSWDEIDSYGRRTAHVQAEQPSADYFHWLFDPLAVGPPCRYLVRRAALLDAGGFASSLDACEDWDMWLRLAHRGFLPLAVPDACPRYRNHATSLSKNYALMWRSGTRVLARAGESDRWCERCREGARLGRLRWREWCYHSMFAPELGSLRREWQWAALARRTVAALRNDPGLVALLAESTVSRIRTRFRHAAI